MKVIKSFIYLLPKFHQKLSMQVQVKGQFVLGCSNDNYSKVLI